MKQRRKPEGEHVRTISLTMSPRLIAQATVEARALGMTRSALISFALAEWLRGLPNKKGQ